MPLDLKPLAGDDEELMEFAQEIVDRHGDREVGVHTVGAAVRDRDGRMFGGINLYHFTGGPCAELVALGHARASGASELTTIVAMRDQGRGPIGPCGRDRQVLFDYQPQIRVILPTPEGVRSVRVVDLMPLASVWIPGEGTQDLDPTVWNA